MKTKRFWLLLVLVLVLGMLLRTRDFDQRFLFGGDVGRDLLVAKGAILLGKLPWVGNFSSAGPFVFGPIYYWFLMLCLILFPKVFLAPWLALLAISLLLVVVMALAGRAVGGSRFGLVVALLMAVSPLASSFSSYLQQHAMVSIFTGLTLLGLVAYAKNPRLIFVFLAGSGIGGGIAMHYQGLNLLAYIPFFYLVERPNFKKWVKLSVVLGLGIIIPYAPLLIWDATRHFRNLEQVIYFFRIGQQRFYVSNRWLTYLSVFWPQFIGKMFGGNYFAGALIGVGTIIVLGISGIKKKLPWSVILLTGVLLIQVVMLRYYRGEKYDGYLIYFHPLVLFLIGTAMYYLLRWTRKVGFLVVMIFVVGSIYSTNQYWSYPNQVEKLRGLVEVIRTDFHSQKVALYGRGLGTSNSSSPLSYLLLFSDLEDDNGIPVGVCRFEVASCVTPGAKELAKTDFQGEPIVIADLSTVPRGQLTKKNDWYQFSVLAMYDDVQNWWRKGL